MFVRQVPDSYLSPSHCPLCAAGEVSCYSSTCCVSLISETLRGVKGSSRNVAATPSCAFDTGVLNRDVKVFKATRRKLILSKSSTFKGALKVLKLQTQSNVSHYLKGILLPPFRRCTSAGFVPSHSVLDDMLWACGVGALSVRFNVSGGECCSHSGCKQVGGGSCFSKMDVQPFVGVTRLQRSIS